MIIIIITFNRQVPFFSTIKAKTSKKKRAHLFVLITLLIHTLVVHAITQYGGDFIPQWHS